MQIDWNKYIALARQKSLNSSQLAQVIRRETQQRVHISEVRRHLSTEEFVPAEAIEDSGVDIVELNDAEAFSTTLKISSGHFHFNSRRRRPRILFS